MNIVCSKRCVIVSNFRQRHQVTSGSCVNKPQSSLQKLAKPDFAECPMSSSLTRIMYTRSRFTGCPKSFLRMVEESVLSLLGFGLNISFDNLCYQATHSSEERRFDTLIHNKLDGKGAAQEIII